ncbi:kielin/chordin-like protein [Trichomycterus rosablanca]|uniref:kielin/chordin-like protein n=1 Tax=Trichomycterus rosablanca TaxID=2290929 RepID=UPI002F35C2A9
MEVLRRSLLFAELTLFALWSVSFSSEMMRDQDQTVIDLLEALNITSLSRGITKARGHDPSIPAWRFRSRTPHLTLPLKFTHHLMSLWQGSLSLHLIGQQAKGSEATLISLSSAHASPLFQLISNTQEDFLQLEFHSNQSGKSEVLNITGGNPFSGGKWVRIALSVVPGHVLLYQECKEATVLQLKGQPLKLSLPQDLQVTFSSTPEDKASKFNGCWQTAELSIRPYESRPWLCDNITDQLPKSFPTSGAVMTSAPEHRPVESQQVVQDQPDRTVSTVLGPQALPLSRPGIREPSQCPDHLKETIESMTSMLNMLKAQNEDLQARVRYLESCECVRRTCTWNGHDMEEGARWATDSRTVCSCVSGKVQCAVSNACDLDGRPYYDPFSTVDGCQTCTCRNGDVSCVDTQKCAVSCQDGVKPAFGSCCRDCSRCDYQGEIIPVGASFSDHGDPCKKCVCHEGNVVCSSVSCSKLDCTLLETVGGECCPRCRSCIQNDVRYQHGSEWQHPENSCSVCTCTEGQVHCTSKACNTPCTSPASVPGICCPVCDGCGMNGLNYLNGEQVPSRDRCEQCVCVNGNVHCQPLTCPATPCSHPVRKADDCCPRCEQCDYESELYLDGQRFSSKSNPCLSCQCLAGEVVCERTESSCPPLSCTHPAKQPGRCCPTCDYCDFDNRVFIDGETFPSPVNPCQECVCTGGHVDCHQECPRPNCHYPRPGTCCQNNCNGCSYAGKDFPNGMEFSHPTDKCRECHCFNGNVQCLMKRCHPVKCGDPFMTPGECCPRCPAPPADCVYEGSSYRHTQHFYHPMDSCQSCFCTNGTVNCNRKPCPFVHCSHPILEECCRTCDGCMYNGIEHSNGAVFTDISDPCGMCVCREGTVTCERRRCPPITCPFPVQEECCQSCNGCKYGGIDYLSGQEFPDPADRCNHCVCMNGHVTCSKKPCYNPGCSHPATMPGHCCPVCDGCSYNGVLLLNGQAVPDRTDPCSECLCRAGTVQCARRVCAAASCPYPVSGSCGCPVCEGCLYQGGDYADGELFPAPTSACEECTCTKGKVSCTPKTCHEVTCPHPGVDPCGCAVCDGCNFHNRQCINGEPFPDPEDHCQHCTCLNGDVSCVPVPCPSLSCRRPVKPAGECCPVCTGRCEHLGQEYESGSTFIPGTDRCMSCTCLNKVVSCQRKPCAQQCTHPGRFTDCCPVCDVCLYEGVQYVHTQTFTPQSDPCQQCVCLSGSVTCTRVSCPIITCENQVTPPGQCCPQCRVCMQHGLEYTEGQSWSLLSDPCSWCTCLGGKAKCIGPECADLSCMHQVTDSCCPRCRGCVYDGIEHAEGSTWFASSSPCMSCMCVDGVTTCSEIQCLSPCVNQISVPGECCPLCADCIYDGHVYGPGENFHPSEDPCQICTCEVMPDGQQHLRCFKKQCPSLVGCPKHNILFSGPDSCCPVCAQPLSNCTAALIGNEVLASDDPCFTCHCKDLTWTCIHQACPPLNCPADEQYIPPDFCCPVCDVCVVEGGRGRVRHGETWTDSEDDCITCSCNHGHIECNIEECAPIICQDGLIKIKSPGRCCYECQDVIVQCVYEGQVYNSNEHWDVDECTSCTCVSGDVHCQTERCPAVSCASDETPSLIPGMCCPHCIPRPATCLVFGDPHYRTFDGKMVNFQGACTYVLAQDCEGGDFSVHVTNDDRGRKGVSWTKEVTVYIGDVVVQLLQEWLVKVDHQTVSLPFLKEPYVYLERKTNNILLNTNIGLKVLWNGRSHLEVSVPGTYKNHMCGLCGNFNNYPQDDMRLRTGQISTSEATFGNNWKVGSGNNSSKQCSDARNIDPCKEAGYFARKSANSRCAMLKSSVFERCHKVVPPEMFFASCVYDLCACGSNTDECVCDALEAYASECREAGVVLHWRSPSLCAVGCPVDRGYIFDECGPPCPKTCFNKDVPLGVIEEHCFKPCVPGCQCPAGLVEHEAHCITPEKCPKIIYGSS